MTYDEFERGFQQVLAEHPLWFDLERDAPASVSDIRQAERDLGVMFPAAYKEFVSSLGGGYFGFSNVYSVQQDSEWNIVTVNRDADLIRRGILVVSENGAGDFYGFKVEGSIATSEIVFADHEEEYAISPTEYSDLFEYLVDKAFSP